MKDAPDFEAINQAGLAAFPAVLGRLLPRGKTVGREIVALNPRRADRTLGSFKINRFNGRWCDFATGDRGGDPVSLVAYLADVSQAEAARLLAQMLGIETGGRHHGQSLGRLRALDRSQACGRRAARPARPRRGRHVEADLPTL
jgi:hypothetical protein